MLNETVTEAQDSISQATSTSGLIFAIIMYVMLVVAMWKIYEKAGEKGWKSLIPIYNIYIMYKIAWGNGWLFLLSLIPVVNIVVSFIVDWKLVKSFGKGIGMFILAIFFSPIALLILGFGNAEYKGPQ